MRVQQVATRRVYDSVKEQAGHRSAAARILSRSPVSVFVMSSDSFLSNSSDSCAAWLQHIRIVLVGTTHPGNIGAAARAMKNMGLRQLVLVAPKSFPDEEATARASGAEDVLQHAHVVGGLADALQGCVWVAGTSARSRALEKLVLTPRDLSPVLLDRAIQGPVALVFGRERTGLRNEELDLCHVHVQIPTAPDYASLNLGAAVQLLAYELRLAALERNANSDAQATTLVPMDVLDQPASSDMLEGLFAHLERALRASGFLDPGNPRQLMRRLRRLFLRAEPEQREVHILRGMLSSFEPRVEKSDKIDQD